MTSTSCNERPAGCDVRMRGEAKGHTLDYYKKTFFAVQLAIAAVCWMTYRAAGSDFVPVGTVFIVMQVSAVIGSMWASRLHTKMTAAGSRVVN